MPLFSVIIPLYNKENYIQQTIESVLQQTVADFELLVVNDASTDKSVSVVSQILDPRIKLIENSKNLGLSATRNHGITNASGEIIALLDADDLWLPTFLEAIKNLHETFPEASVYGTDYAEMYESQEDLSPKKNIPISRKGTSFLMPDFFEASMFQPIFSQSSVAFKKEICKEKTVFNPEITFAEDIDFYINYGSKYKIAYQYEMLSKVRFDVPNQMSRAGIASKVLPDLDSYETLAKENPSLKKYLDLYRYIFASMYTFENAIPQRNAMLKQLDYNNLTFKQRLLLKSPRFVILLLKKVKGFLLKRNVRVTSF
ncbi:UDP-Glc:alpha-D-GlcNAc-diphosphoundecaprenol beta-1,3-glucosyltransferase WfgD [Kordia antarctica]|uniref:UDP-Glc:alpha-D-GlcNAc-diphosphoundecaprenol beta-1,3-glucosyltransferase WfgD n=1 Tax=Kordia antarctica TaxID=1218801 RepID=A0A7L4ZIP6_9FLAO|nr:glycosyltransferase family 2 protein [Kordia antarctica]QHI36347.1 UDP-Glc:alpha-D-GlcNAc-diphosphoundecaprenol beta-1,3-glucosyltransferase WfgD [Kordia antarctica]